VHLYPTVQYENNIYLLFWIPYGNNIGWSRGLSIFYIRYFIYIDILFYRGRQWCGIFHYHWWTASIKPRLLFSHSGLVSWGLPFLQFDRYIRYIIMCYIQHKFDMNCRTWRVKCAPLITGGSKHEIYELLNVHLKHKCDMNCWMCGSK